MSNDKIRVLHIVTDLNRGGLETFLMNHYRYINRDKIQFDFLVHRADAGQYEEEALALGSNIYHISRLKPFNRKYENELKQFFQRHPYKIIHVHQDCLSSVILKVAKDCGIPVRIAHSHSSNQEKDLKYPIKLFYKKRIKHYATDLWSCGTKAGQWMFETNDFLVFHNAVDTDRFIYDEATRQRIRKEFSILEDTFLIGQVANFSPTKNHVFTLDIFQAIHNRCPNSKLIFVGDGRLREKIEQSIREHNLEDSVILTGVRSDVEQLLQAFDVFVLPSCFEGLPVTLIEAQAAGLPCVLSDGVPEEAVITPIAYRISLSLGADKWADDILKKKGIVRKNMKKEIIESGYDVLQNVKKMEEYYIEYANRE